MNQRKEGYAEARAKAQLRANETGFDYGMQWSEPFREWNVFMLPMKCNRSGREVLCEVVMCESLEKCRPGHGPVSS